MDQNIYKNEIRAIERPETEEKNHMKINFDTKKEKTNDEEMRTMLKLRLK